MKVIEMLENIDENKIVNLVYRGEIVSYYDGKNSIDEIYNEREVIDVDIFDGAYFLEINNPINNIINDMRSFFNIIILDDISGDQLSLDTDFSNYDLVGCYSFSCEDDKDLLKIYVMEV